MVGRIHPDVLVYTAGKDAQLDLALVEVDCIGTAAHVTMLSRMPSMAAVLGKRERGRVVSELVAIMRQARADAFKITAQDQDVHLAVERKLTAKLGDLGKRVHTARSRNDQVALDLRLYAREQLLGMMEEVVSLVTTLLAVAGRYRKTPMVGRTHMQPAMPSSVGVWASAHAESLLDDLGLLLGAYALNDRCPLGSAAGYGVSMPIDRDLTARLMGFDAPVHNVLYAANSRGKCESVILSAASQVMLSLARLSEDMILYMMPEFGYFRLPPEFCTGSSIMPQKNNPDVFELVRARTMRVLTSASCATGILKGLPSGYNRDLQEIKEPFLAGVDTTRQSLRVLTLVMDRLEIDKKALADAFRPDVFAADRALELVVQGMPFRDAYEQVRDDLASLSNPDPKQAIAAKTHIGAPAGLDIALLKQRAAETTAFVRKKRGRYFTAISKLLGVKYPELKDC